MRDYGINASTSDICYDLGSDHHQKATHWKWLWFHHYYVTALVK